MQKTTTFIVVAFCLLCLWAQNEILRYPLTTLFCHFRAIGDLFISEPSGQTSASGGRLYFVISERSGTRRRRPPELWTNERQWGSFTAHSERSGFYTKTQSIKQNELLMLNKFLFGHKSV